MNSPSAISSRAMRRSARKGEMKETMTISPASAISLRHFGDAADVLDAVGVGEAEVAVEAVADIVAVEHIGVAARRVQLLFEQVGDGRLAGARQAGEPEHRRAAGSSAAARAFLSTSSDCQWMLSARRSACSDHAGADRGVGDAVDQDEGAGGAVLGKGVEGDRRLRRRCCRRRPRSAPATWPPRGRNC